MELRCVKWQEVSYMYSALILRRCAKVGVTVVKLNQSAHDSS